MINVQEKIWGNNWFLNSVIGIILFGLAQLNIFYPIEKIVYDWSFQLTKRHHQDEVVVIAIDEKSLSQLGDWPWPRTILAQIVDKLSPYANTIALPFAFDKSQQTLSQSYFDELNTFFTHSSLVIKNSFMH